MKTLHRYLLGQVLATLFMTVLVFTFVLLLATVFSSILTPLISGQISVMAVMQTMGLLVPFILAYSLPMGMLTATLLVFGRFSADQELTAARASGVSLLSLTVPVIVLSLLLCGFSAYLNLHLAPTCRVAYKKLLYRMGVKQPSLMLPEGQFVDEFFNDCTFYVGKNDGSNLKDIMVWLKPDYTNIVMRINAPRGTLNVDVVSRKVEIHLFEARSTAVADGGFRSQYMGEWTYERNMKNSLEYVTPIGNMTFTQLQVELADMKKRIAASSLFRAPGAAGAGVGAEKLSRSPDELTSPVRVLLNRQMAFSFACFGFTLVGIPLAIRVQRRETNIGFAIALVLVVVYYSFLILGESFSKRPEFFPQIIVWLPNFIFQGVGAVLLWRANRGI